ncbi:MAG: DJ-1/PfpI family protein [Deltaproteobacteria bacterium]|nr:DJ-1/PfpI family protein [Deltaproteobacteria bacterium]
MHIGLLLFPELTQLDLTGPFEVLHRIPGATVHLVWKDLQPVRADSGLAILPTTTIADCPALDVVMVPGGFGQIALMDDEEILTWLRAQAVHAKYMTAVCTGALLLGGAGLLDGYRATTHWAFTELLADYGAIYTPGRVVEDRDRITGGGVSAGIDFALLLAARLANEQVAKAIQLGIEYNPAPPFAAGHPDVAEPELVALVRERLVSRGSARFAKRR